MGSHAPELAREAYGGAKDVLRADAFCVFLVVGSARSPQIVTPQGTQ